MFLFYWGKCIRDFIDKKIAFKPGTLVLHVLCESLNDLKGGEFITDFLIGMNE